MATALSGESKEEEVAAGDYWRDSAAAVGFWDSSESR